MFWIRISAHTDWGPLYAISYAIDCAISYTIGCTIVYAICFAKHWLFHGLYHCLFRDICQKFELGGFTPKGIYKW